MAMSLTDCYHDDDVEQLLSILEMRDFKVHKIVLPLFITSLTIHVIWWLSLLKAVG